MANVNRRQFLKGAVVGAVAGVVLAQPNKSNRCTSPTPNIVWMPQPGSQPRFLRCPIFELLYEGTRGPGKTDSLLMDYAQFVGKGFGSHWRGVLFRRSYPELDEVIVKSKRWFHRMFPGARYNAGDHRWVWPTGEQLLFRFADQVEDYWKYHGHEFPWVGWDELTEWPSDDLYIMMMSVCRSTHPNVPRHYRASCNPHGPGHNWVKARFIDPAPRMRVIVGDNGQKRMAIHGSIWENRLLLQNDPAYVRNLMQQSGPIRQAWLEGDWNIIAGGMFDDVWRESTHVIKPFKIPASWRLDRSFDWGSAKPYSVGFWAESDGTDAVLADGSSIATQPGTIYRIGELYGWTGKPNEGTRELASTVAKKILAWETVTNLRFEPGPADSAIYTVDDGQSIAMKMEAQGVRWLRANKSSGSRVNGWELMRQRLMNSRDKEGPGLYVFDNCRQSLRTVPVLPRDPRKPEDADTRVEDHIADEWRYRCLVLSHSVTVRQCG